MALGTVTVLNDEGRSGGPYPLGLITVVGDDAYPAGGTPDFQQAVRDALGANVEVLAVQQQNLSDHVCRYDKANDKLMVQLMSTGAEASGDLSSTTFTLLVFGK